MNYSKAYAAYISPEDFLSLTTTNPDRLLPRSCRSVEEHGREVAQRALRRRVQGVLQKGEPLYPVVPEKVKENMNV